MAEVVLENVYKRFGNVTAVSDFSLDIADQAAPAVTFRDVTFRYKAEGPAELGVEEPPETSSGVGSTHPRRSWSSRPARAGCKAEWTSRRSGRWS